MAVDDVVLINDQWYVLATSSRADESTRVLKHKDTFAVFDRYGDIQRLGMGEQGIYHQGTRFLSYFELSINHRRPLLLHSTVKEDNTLLTADITTPDIYQEGQLVTRKGIAHIFRSKLLWDGVHYEHIRLFNYGDKALNLHLEVRFEADYADIFEVRGAKRRKRGQVLPVQHQGRELVFSYRGLDNKTRRTRILLSQPPDNQNEGQIYFAIELLPQEKKQFYFTIACEIETSKPAILTYQQALANSNQAVITARKGIGQVRTSNEQFNGWLNRSAADLQMLATQTEHGDYPYAGVPWFSTPFGRDGIITALQYLWLNPQLARGVLGFLATTQATEENAAQDAEPGKILHETRQGEMAALHEVPFWRYYGSVDATPLFIVLAGAYYHRTADRIFLETIWPNIKAALHWINHYGDCDGDGFVEYARHSADGLIHQGWKDSDDPIFHHGGKPAEGPLALCEVQGYVYEAKKIAAKLAALFGETSCAAELEHQATLLKEKFNQAFWCEEIATFALALDGHKRPCRIISSNAGHALFSGIAHPEHARCVAETLLSEASFSGWGIRTLATTQSRFNPMSYHNGSIWPHDNALVAMGLARYGFKDQVQQILGGLFDASIMMDLHRLPELFCGFDRLPGQGPTLYPVACSPQAWASGTVFYLLQACLGLTFSEEKPQVRFHHPRLPEYLQRLEITNLRFGNAVIDLTLRRHLHDVGVNVLRKEGDIEVAVIV
ncbi:amylo-alpha-1,6-glucosidase [Nitrosococcus watsonii]|uniref:Amylo-alpha-16-glucosidase n=1 Tax=Nitrosococcus watsoni (strain C-113) TaxID=105559 RepID=D8K6E2_NITWC|nr:amylo-alpha-1,6-glucosidase [Nitrosococcus watsonii]ADJ28469.1 Amylo-alpha-16-glucosidase [Nitrosococcus watsonii C-113]